METFDELYYREPFTREFDARVVACVPGEKSDGAYEVELDETAFYPEGGGQPGDRGTLVLLDENGEPVAVDTAEKDASQENPAEPASTANKPTESTDATAPASSAQGADGEEPAGEGPGDEQAASKAEAPAIHVLDTQKRGDHTVEIIDRPLEAGTRVRGVLDWTWRSDNTEAHTGEHIVSGIVHGLYGYNNVGFHMGERCIEVDFDGILTEEQALDVEQRANAAVREDLPVEVLLPSPEELAAMDYRSKKELEGPVRVVRIPGVDMCACCGTHLATTGQVGLIKVLRVTTKKKKTRLELLCGRRALLYCEDETRWLHKVSNFLSVGDEEAEEAVRRLSAEKDELKHELKQAHRHAIEEEVAGLAAKGATQSDTAAPDDGSANGRGPLVCYKSTFDVDEQRYYCEQVIERRVAPVCAVLSDGTGKQAGRVNYVIASAELDLRPTCKQLNKQLQGRGGGKPNMVQGSFAAPLDDIEAALRQVK